MMNQTTATEFVLRNRMDLNRVRQRSRVKPLSTFKYLDAMKDDGQDHAALFFVPSDEITTADQFYDRFGVDASCSKTRPNGVSWGKWVYLYSGPDMPKETNEFGEVSP